MNDFIKKHMECIEGPIAKGSLQGFQLNNGYRILFNNKERLTIENKIRLINWYNKL